MTGPGPVPSKVVPEGRESRCLLTALYSLRKGGETPALATQLRQVALRDRLVGTGSPGLAILARMAFTSEVLKGRGVSPWAPSERISGGVIAPWTAIPRSQPVLEPMASTQRENKQGER